MEVNSSQKWRVDDAEALERPEAGERGAKRCGILKKEAYQVKISDTFEALKISSFSDCTKVSCRTIKEFSSWIYTAMKLVGSDVKFNWSRPFVCCDNVTCKRCALPYAEARTTPCRWRGGEGGNGGVVDHFLD